MQRLNCEHFPCHFSDQDCAFCFCPFYPCHDKRTGGIESGEMWSCEGCLIMHQKDVAEMVMSDLLRGETLTFAWARVERLL